jgi:Protein affecting phage T7 exclusion by the F plasmid|tara:strand:+ start:368 stop:739 length:372 start_codon:yes stop_codon:yes gene_type:complete
MIKIGQNIGAFNTVILIFLTAITGIYYARIEGLNTLRSGVYNLYKNKVPIFELISGASIAVAAILLIIPGFITDTVGFLLLIPFTRKLIIKTFFNQDSNVTLKNDDFIEGEILKDKNKDKDEL